MTLLVGRRGFLAGLASLVCAAPAIVRIDSIMKVKPVVIAPVAADGADFANISDGYWGQLKDITEQLALHPAKVQAWQAAYQGMNPIAYFDPVVGRIVVKEVDIVENEILGRAVSRDPELRMRLGGGQTVEEIFLPQDLWDYVEHKPAGVTVQNPVLRRGIRQDGGVPDRVLKKFEDLA